MHIDFRVASLAVLLFLATGLVPGRAGAEAESADPKANDASLVVATERFAFHSNFWINLHHFLHRQAQRPDGAPIDGGRALSREAFQQLDGAIDWYREHLAEHSLLMNQQLYGVKRALIAFGPDQRPDAPAVTAEHLAQLEAAAPVYRRYYWARHDQQNRETVSWHLARIRALEQPVLTRIAELAQQPWPEEMIRVDLTWDANWAGAYCTTQPIHAVLTSRVGGPDNRWPPGGWLELLFHEPSHAVIDPGRSTVGRLLGEIAAEEGAADPGQLWHAVLFLFSGTAVREALALEGVEHRLLMETEDIFGRYQPAVQDGLGAYIAGEGELGAALRATVASLEGPP